MLKRAVITAVFCLLALSAHAGPIPSTLNVGIYPSYPPLDMRDPSTGALSGFDVDLSAKLAERLGTKFEFQETAFAQLIASVQTGRISLFFNGMNDTAPRRELISFVDYLSSGTQFLIRAADTETLKSDTDLCGKTVAGNRSTNLPGQVVEWSKAHCEAAGKPAIVIAGADNTIDARSQLKQGRVDAIVQDSLTIPSVASKEPGTYATLGAPFNVTVMGIGVNRSDTELQSALLSALQALIDSGDYAALMNKWGLPETSAVAHVTINGG
jgi:polar amino acid transport system substrate-binding protein